MSTRIATAPPLKSYRFRTNRAFKALDDGTHRKWVLVVAAKDLSPQSATGCKRSGS